MASKIYIAPFVRGPHVAAAVAPQSIWTTCWKNIGRSMLDLAPQRLIDKSGTLFAIEVTLVGALIGTGFVWLGGGRDHLLAVVLWIDGLLGVCLLAGNLVRSAFEKNPVDSVSIPATAVRHWAYRVTNYRGPRSEAAQRATRTASALTNYGAITELVAGDQFAITSPSAATEISSQLDLEAIDPAGLSEADIFLVEANQTIFADGRVLEGIAMVDESAISGQSAPVLRWSSGETVVMRDSRVVEGKILVQVAPRRGHPLDWMGDAPAVRRPKVAEASK
jgi:hypothetical protein